MPYDYLHDRGAASSFLIAARRKGVVQGFTLGRQVDDTPIDAKYSMPMPHQLRLIWGSKG